MQTHTFAVILAPEEAGFRAWCPALREMGAAAQGANETETLANLQEVVKAILDDLRRNGRPLPEGARDPVDGVRATITIIDDDTGWTADDLARLGMPFSAGVRKLPKVIKKKR